jgi:single-strand DNA-binding protein
MKDKNSGEWTDVANYFNVTVFGAQAERYSQWLTKGRQIAVDGRLRWREWQTQDGQKREAVEIVADNVQFIGPREPGSGSAPNAGGKAAGPAFSDDGLGVPESDFAEDEDIPF